ncbi:nitroreductase family protein [Fusibacter ferrireducens]|uniref:Nitroreductase family protein n=1 Tax=Fusibacter ferrireducens TaxID=2785058 RepID=A0ABR9ZRA6_9FIRM|nr:nitroreductase family protein [Fusibacter ferrireducens]MBF4692688.1 nitroreductase family protein [Fusibacter ferrireducens]
MLLRDAFTERRSVNFFNPEKEVTDQTLKEIVELAGLAPSAFNLQPWRVIAVRSEAQKELLSENANKQPKIKEAPVTLIVVGDREGYRPENSVWAELKAMIGDEQAQGAIDAAGFLYGSSEERKIKFAESNAGLYAMSIMLAAKDLGVDSHAMSGVDFEGIKKAFNLNASEEVVMLIGLGHYDETKALYPRRTRRSLEEVLEIV